MLQMSECLATRFFHLQASAVGTPSVALALEVGEAAQSSAKLMVGFSQSKAGARAEERGRMAREIESWLERSTRCWRHGVKHTAALAPPHRDPPDAKHSSA